MSHWDHDLKVKMLSESNHSYFCSSNPLHSYYENGRTAVLQDFFNVSVLDSFIGYATKTKKYVNEYQPDAELWLGETSSTFGGGTPTLSDAYVAGFM